MSGSIQKHPAHRVGDTNLADFKVGVDNVIFSVDTEQNQLLVLLIMRHDAPYSGTWSLPGTLVRQGESLEDAAYRVLSEKIRAENLYLEQLYTFGGPGRDPRIGQEAPDRRPLLGPAAGCRG